MIRFADRTEAGRVLARSLAALAGRSDVTVIPIGWADAPLASAVAFGLGRARLVTLPISGWDSSSPGVQPSFCTCDAFASAVRDHTVVLVDDGIEHAAPAAAAIATVRALNPARLILATPAVSQTALDGLSGRADEMVYLSVPRPFHSVAFWYDDSWEAAKPALAQDKRATSQPSTRGVRPRQPRIAMRSL